MLKRIILICAGSVVRARSSTSHARCVLNTTILKSSFALHDSDYFRCPSSFEPSEGWYQNPIAVIDIYSYRDRRDKPGMIDGTNDYYYLLVVGDEWPEVIGKRLSHRGERRPNAALNVGTPVPIIRRIRQPAQSLPRVSSWLRFTKGTLADLDLSPRIRRVEMFLDPNP